MDPTTGSNPTGRYTVGRIAAGMILDPDDDVTADDASDEEEEEEEEEEAPDAGEWQAGLCRLGFASRGHAGALELSPDATALAAPDRAPAATSPSANTAAVYRRVWSESTVAAYQGDWRLYSVWCDVAGIDDPLAAGRVAVSNYVAALTAQRLSPATIRRRLAATVPDR